MTAVEDFDRKYLCLPNGKGKAHLAGLFTDKWGFEQYTQKTLCGRPIAPLVDQRRGEDVCKICHDSARVIEEKKNES